MQTNKKTELGNGIDLALEECKKLICEMIFNKEATREELKRVFDYSISLIDCIKSSEEMERHIRHIIHKYNNEISSLRNKYLKEKNNAN